jgi:hypothetical protein
MVYAFMENVTVKLTTIIKVKVMLFLKRVAHLKKKRVTH